ncbi:MAG: hypothetical protein ACYCS7_04410 [Acidimicrobiales bacterium]
MAEPRQGDIWWAALECVASFDNLQTILRRDLVNQAGRLGFDHRDKICIALEAMADC